MKTILYNVHLKDDYGCDGDLSRDFIISDEFLDKDTITLLRKIEKEDEDEEIIENLYEYSDSKFPELYERLQELEQKTKKKYSIKKLEFKA